MPAQGQRMSLLALDGVTKRYPGVTAVDGVSFRVGRGEIHALLGENGAGKSTVVKAIYGLVRPDAGAMTLDGAPHAPASPAEARGAGVAMVFQHFSLWGSLDVAENVALGLPEPPRDLRSRIAEVSRAYGLPLDPARRVGDLSAGERQRVEIVRCLLQEPRLLMMDEPTSVLTPQEVGLLFETLGRLAAAGTAILYISHKLAEIRELCEGATILRRGRVVASLDPRRASPAELAEAMVGAVPRPAARPAAAPGPMRLEAEGLDLPAETPLGTSLRGVGLRVRAGEVLGVGGVAGNGQDELLAALSGERRTARGAVRLAGEPVGHPGPARRRALGLLAAPEERLGHAGAPDMSLTENVLVTARHRRGLARRGWIDWGRTRAYAREVVEAFDVRTPGPEHAARSLSGGNLQRFMIGREILQEPAALVVNQPTWGVDAGAAAAIRRALVDLAGRGAAVIVISQDLEELMEMAGSFAALNEGRLSRARPMAELTLAEIGLMLGGVHGAGPGVGPGVEPGAEPAHA
jgi:simple sugar transport system ATP-binding protein